MLFRTTTYKSNWTLCGITYITLCAIFSDCCLMDIYFTSLYFTFFYFGNGFGKNPLEFKCTSIILPRTFLLSPFPLSNKGIGMGTVWPTSGVPSSFLRLATIIVACLSWLSIAPERWRTRLCLSYSLDTTPLNHILPHLTRYHIHHGYSCHIWCIYELLMSLYHTHNTSGHPENKKL